MPLRVNVVLMTNKIQQRTLNNLEKNVLHYIVNDWQIFTDIITAWRRLPVST